MYSFKRIRLVPKINGRLLVTSDIHGHLEHLKAVLKKADFSENDLLLIVGDMLDKGPKSLETLRFIMKLCAEGRAIAMMGNVDYLRLISLKYTMDNKENTQNFLDYINYVNDWKGTCFYKELFNEIGVEPNSIEAINGGIQAVWEHFKKEFDFLRSLPTVAETEKYVFIHGGLPHGDKEFGLTEDSGKDVLTYLKADAFCERARTQNRRFDRYVVCGHWPVLNYGGKILCCNPITDSETNIISIDGGCGLVREGQLNLLSFPSLYCEPNDITLYTYDSLCRVTAIEEQKESDEPFSVTWSDTEVTLISLNGDIAEVEHIATGKRLFITADALWKDVKALKRGDISKIRQSTNYRLPVNTGDTLSVIRETSIGLLAKKEGVIGWYYGKYARI